MGEEYDGGQVYSGVNHSPVSRGVNVGWKHWLSEPEKVQIEGGVIRVQEYAWYSMARGPFRTSFYTDGSYSRWLLRFSLSGCETQDACQVTLDDEVIPWVSKGTLDRSIEDFLFEEPLGAGTHLLQFRELKPPLSGNPVRQLCSVTLREYRAEPQFHWSPSFVGVYPTWRLNKVLAGYRPANEGNNDRSCCVFLNDSTHSLPDAKHDFPALLPCLL